MSFLELCFKIVQNLKVKFNDLVDSNAIGNEFDFSFVFSLFGL